MSKNNREKILGQFFSGHAVANLLYALLDHTGEKTMIDPMCGKGDMFSPFRNTEIKLYGNEIDTIAFNNCSHSYPTAILWNLNCFSNTALNNYLKHGYDIVMTNPPYIRYQLQSDAADIVGEWLLLEQIKESLISFAKRVGTLDSDEKEMVMEQVTKISGLSDLAVPSWILCMMLVKKGGQLALVLPNSWLNREYSKPIKILLSRLFEIEYIINDANAIWFKGKAQVKTTILIAKRKKPQSNSMLSYVDLFQKAGDATCITANIETDDLRHVFNYDSFGNDMYTVRKVPSQSFLFNTEQNQNGEWFSLLNRFTTKDKLVSLTDIGVQTGQGLRSGANVFFYVPFNYNSDKQSEKYLIEVIQNQQELPSCISIKHGTCKLLYIQDSVIPSDFETIPNKFRKKIKVLPPQICDYINKKSHEKKGDKFIPELSSVKTNVSKGNEEKPPRFWYMLPPLAKRHKAELFIPRVNGGKPMTRLNLKERVVDANFTTMWLSEESDYDIYSILAILNSTWCAIQYEEVGSVMGGGALKLDAVQLKKILLPVFNRSQIERLHKIGNLLKSENFISKKVTEEIDTIFLEAIGEVSNQESSLNILNSYWFYYYNQRNNEF